MWISWIPHLEDLADLGVAVFKFILILLIGFSAWAREVRENENQERIKCVLKVATKCPDPRMAKDDMEMQKIFVCRIKEISKCNKDNLNESN